ncbi:MAG TPA: SpoIIE family protein phosphatase [Thermoanaerobaculia bacterium]|jgi:serine phosphatase RsbU (regulator of sigma subunit)|nr:SpoIIE family protein phosphatase [Thermoanaerobaculia bacterium]
MLTSVVALLITLGVLAFYDRKTYTEKMMRDVNVLAGVIGENAASSIVFNDPETAKSTLSALRAQPHITHALLFAGDGRVFAEYGHGPVDKQAPRDGATLIGNEIEVTSPILFNNARVGTVHLHSDIGELRERRRRYLVIAGMVLVGASLVALLFSLILQRAISRPLLALRNVAKRVSREKNYELRANKSSDDEVGQVIDGFNEMLGEIRKRDAEIQDRHRQEMALARSIQTSVLPRTFEFPGFDVSAVMYPAEEVGGDFYEFRPSNGSAWISVGDVTGHGVTSGLIMMMAQSMFTMLCEQSNGHTRPSDFVTLLNRAMFYNLRARLGQDRFMTLVVAKLAQDGEMSYAGSHTDILIYRASNDRVDRLATDGLWLGIENDIAPMTTDQRLKLNRGDVALFHTDGVTEARNSSGEFFDMDRLTKQLHDLHGATASEIVTKIANAAWSWAGTPKDDVSLLAVKRT